MGINNTCEQHPKIRLAEDLERAANELERLSRRARELGGCLDVFYMSKDLPNWQVRVKRDFKPKVRPAYLRLQSAILKKQHEQDLADKIVSDFDFDAQRTSEKKPAQDCNQFIERIQKLALDLELAAHSAIRAELDCRGEFVQVFFKRAVEMARELKEAGL